MIATATRLQVSGLRGWFHFLMRIGAVNRQLRNPPGLLHREVRGLRTLTVWTDRESMTAFRNGGAHKMAMLTIPKIGRATSVSWEVDRPPTWDEALAKYQAKFPRSAL